MSRPVAVVVVTGLLVAACSFDGGNTASSGEGGGGPADASEPDARLPDAAADAAPVCTDEDGDAFMAGGPSCGELLDCNDADPDAYPGQTEFFAEAMADGSFDYNCDGREEVAADDQGGDCDYRDFACRGDGWLDAVPACGEPGTWSECGIRAFSCVEVDTDPAVQPCR